MADTNHFCNICPRKCNINRGAGQKGACKMGENITVARCNLHFWEEPCISGKNGSGTIFFSGCNLGCVFCQNYDISENLKGKQITVDRLVELFKELESKNANNINLVTPTHFSNMIIKALEIYKPKIPVVYNSSGYESVETLKKLEPYIDVYLPDLKYLSNETGKKYSKVSNYADVATLAILEMVAQKGECKLNDNGIIQSGVIIRNLILPSNTKNSIEVLNWIKENINNPTVSLMAQYTPYGRANEFKEINRKITKREYEKVCDYFFELNLDGYIQERSSASEEFIPSWDFK